MLEPTADPSKRIAGKTIPDLLHGPEFHGSTDGLILLRLARKALGSAFDAQHAASQVDGMMNEMYNFVSRCSDDEVATGIAPLPGVIQTLKRLATDYVNNGVACGLVTGNVEGIARRKMNALGIYNTGALTTLEQPQGQREWDGTEHIRFLGGFGSDYCSGDIDNLERNYLDRGEQIAICVNRCLDLCATKDLQRVIHVGDAPADILAAKSYVDHPDKPKGLCVSVVGVATGSYSVDEIQSLCGECIPGVWEPKVLDQGQGVGNEEEFLRACGLISN
jgi:phosphoglycolate phosphatase-like HAD superfamily hydrolase